MSDGHQEAAVDTLFVNTIIMPPIIDFEKLPTGEIKLWCLNMGKQVVTLLGELLLPLLGLSQLNFREKKANQQLFKGFISSFLELSLSF